MVIGEVVQVQPEILLKPLKVQDLTSNYSAEHLWPQEVNHVMDFLKAHYNQSVPHV